LSRNLALQRDGLAEAGCEGIFAEQLSPTAPNCTPGLPPRRASHRPPAAETQRGRHRSDENHARRSRHWRPANRPSACAAWRRSLEHVVNWMAMLDGYPFNYLMP
jgi:hypothetical protein